MNFKRLLNTKLGVFFISAILGLGLAMLFRQACNGKDCITFKGPRVGEIDGKIYQFGDSCYSYHLVPTKCDANKKTLELQPQDPKQKTQDQFTDKDVQTAFHELSNETQNDTQHDKSTDLGDFFTNIKQNYANLFSS